MSRIHIRMTIDFCAKDQLERFKLAELHHLVVDQVNQHGFSDCVKVTLEYDGMEFHKQPVMVPEPIEDSPKGPVMSALSERQWQIAEMLCNHYSIKRMAGELYVSVNTVKKHIQNMKKTLGIDSSGADFIYTLKQMMQRGNVAGENTSIG